MVMHFVLVLHKSIVGEKNALSYHYTMKVSDFPRSIYGEIRKNRLSELCE